MEALTIKLTKEQQAFVDKQVSEQRFRTANAYVRSLVEAERKRKLEERMLKLVREARADGPSISVDAEEWGAKRWMPPGHGASATGIRG